VHEIDEAWHMEFITCEESSNQAIPLIHPAKCDGHCFEGLYPYLQGYHIICPTLNEHNLAHKSTYESYHKEADAISAYLKAQGISSLKAVAGLSMGAVVAFELFRRSEFSISHLVLDGAPFYPINQAM
jgi:pimeloyl-ACP methyl ester carboxylesterase